jgi:hypothetical protein
MTDLVTRRRALATLGGGGLLLAGCDKDRADEERTGEPSRAPRI